MNVRRFVIASIVVAIAAFLTDGLIHQVLLKGAYENLTGLTATKEQMDKWFWLFILGRIAFGFLLARVFVWGYSNKGITEGIRFGFLMGLLVWVPLFCVYVTFLPYPKAIDIGEPFAGVIQFLIYGVLLSLIYKPASESAAS